MSTILATLYVFFGNSLSNRWRLARILPFMAVTTMLIILVIKSSLALSLGLVGALSIVRFRTAIKDPEELVYIFLTIALGLGFGADQVGLSVVFFVVLLTVIIASYFLRKQTIRPFTQANSVQLEVAFSKKQSLEKITQAIKPHANEIILNRFNNDEATSAQFLLEPKSPNSIDAITTSLEKIEPKVRVTVLKYQPLV